MHPRGMREREERTRTLRIRHVILLGLLVPVLGLVLVAGSSIRDELAQRDASSRLARSAADIRDGVDFRAAVATEEIHSTVLGLAHDLGIDPDRTDQIDAARIRADLDQSRRAVDAGRGTQAGPAVEAELLRLDGLRRQIDRGTAGNGDVSEVFEALNRALAEQWGVGLAATERIADERPISREMRSRLRTLRYSIEAFTLGGPRVNIGLDLLLESPTTDATRELIALTDRFRSAADRATPVDGTAAAAAWQAFAEDPAAVRTESTLDIAVEIGLGERPAWDDLQLGLVAAGLRDGERWGLLLTEVVEAAAGDLAVSADQRADAADDRVRDEAALALGLVALAIVVGLGTARDLAQPASDLQRAARRVGAGDFDGEPIRVRGPAEIRETVHAFNDMAATLAAVEDHAVALAEDPTSPVLDDPLPGRTGRALQRAIDQLRRSVHQAEVHRAELLELATHDGLTGLLNRAAAFASLQQDLSRARRDGTQLLAFYVDLDGLKSLNDTFGHDVGDDAIVRTADALRATTRESDVVARLGGDEFMVVGPVPEGGRTEIAAFAERIRAAVALQSVDVGGADVAPAPLQHRGRPLRPRHGVRRGPGPGGRRGDVPGQARRSRPGGLDRLTSRPQGAATSSSRTDPETSNRNRPRPVFSMRTGAPRSSRRRLSRIRRLSKLSLKRAGRGWDRGAARGW